MTTVAGRWQWCPGARGRCRECRSTVVGIWRYYVSQTTATVEVCAECVGGEGK